jgi:hypothetical protein
MIINHPFLNRFSPSIKEVIPEIDDDKLTVTNTLNMVGLPPEPSFRAAVGASNVQESSFHVDANVSIANAGASIFTLGILRSGWWKIYVQIAYRGNFVGVTQAGDARISIDAGTGSVQLLTVYANQQVFTVVREMEMMVANQATVTTFLNSNGVGQEHAANFSMVANKLL